MVNVAVIGIIAVLMAIIFKKGREEYSLYISIGSMLYYFAAGYR